MKLGKVRVSFYYGEEENKLGNLRETATCLIKDFDDNLLSQSKITLYFKDVPWEKEQLRKELLKRALWTVSLTKEERGQVWEDYRTSKPTPRWGVGSK
jgi:hypothetical protein